MLRIFLISCLIIQNSICFSQRRDEIDEVFEDLGAFSIKQSEIYEKAEDVPDKILSSFKKQLPKKRKMEFMSKKENLDYIQHGKTNLFGNKKYSIIPRVFEIAYRFENFLIIDYNIKIGTYRVPRRAVIQLDQNNTIDVVLIVSRADISNRNNFWAIKKRKGIYVEEFEYNSQIY